MKRILLFLVAAAVAVGAYAQQDVITVGTATATGNTVDIPVYVRDVGGTPLGVDQAAGSKIQSFSIRVNYSPSSAISGATFTSCSSQQHPCAGITASLSPTFESSPSSAGSISWIATYAEGSATVPFTLNAGAPGNQVAHIVFTLSGSGSPGSQIQLTLDSTVTQLSNQGGTTSETTANGKLALVNGVITLPALTISLSPFSQTIAPGAKANYTVTASGAVSSNTTITLASSSPSVATVPASVTINAGSSTATFQASGIAAGQTQITAQLPNGGASTSALLTVAVPTTCNTPAVPVLSAPSTAASGASYDVTWPASANATEYTIDEATSADFSGATSTTLTDTHKTFSHSVSADTRYYYRVVARNRATGCNVASNASDTVSVLVRPQAPTFQLTRYITVVGSVPGSLGSFFKTSLQLYNPQGATITGKLVYHPGGTSGSDSDPSLPYAIAPGKVLAFADLLPAMGVSSGLGTLDIVGDVNSPLPVALARVFNDAGANGTSGLTEDALKSDDALHAGDTGVLFAPADISKFRLNMGYRTLSDGANVSFTVRDKDGVVVQTSSRTFDPTYFAQPGGVGWALDGYVLKGGETITILVNSGSVFFYGATTDNVTQDPSVQFAKRVE
jgi:hypothetical protein